MTKTIPIFGAFKELSKCSILYAVFVCAECFRNTEVAFRIICDVNENTIIFNIIMIFLFVRFCEDTQFTRIDFCASWVHMNGIGILKKGTWKEWKDFGTNMKDFGENHKSQHFWIKIRTKRNLIYLFSHFTGRTHTRIPNWKDGIRKTKTPLNETQRKTVGILEKNPFFLEVLQQWWKRLFSSIQLKWSAQFLS